MYNLAQPGYNDGILVLNFLSSSLLRPINTLHTNFMLTEAYRFLTSISTSSDMS